jgi:hypothetical protein
VSGAVLAALLGGALAAPPAGAAPELPSASQRYRIELGGVPVGWASLEVACAGQGCELRWTSRLRAPEPAEGAVVAREIRARTARDGRAHEVHATRDDGLAPRATRAGEGPVPASLAELVLSAAAEGERRCVAVREELSGEEGEACATRRGEWLEGSVLGTAVRFRAGRGEAPREVVIAAQGARFVADAAAALPGRPPRLFGAQVPAAPGAAPGAALRFCGRGAEPAGRAGRGAAALPRAFPDGASCRERTARYVTLAQRAGVSARHVVGVAWDGSAFAWHEWAELFTDGDWLPVDPSFGQLPAAGPRFALARFAAGDEAARQAAGRAILECWGRGRVEPERGAAPREPGR